MINRPAQRHEICRRPAQFQPLCDGRITYTILSNRYEVRTGDLVNVAEMDSDPASTEPTGDEWCGYVVHVERISKLFQIASLRFASARVASMPGFNLGGRGEA